MTRLAPLLASLLARELRLAARHGGDTAAAVLFFVLAASCFPLALQPSPALLRRMAPAILFVCALFAALLPLERLLGADWEDGSLDQLLLSGAGGSGVAAVKTLAHFVTTAVPLMLAALPLTPMLSLPLAVLPVLLAALAMTGAAFSLLGTLLASLVLGARRGGVLLPLLALPLLTPVLIFGAAAVDASAAGLAAGPSLLLLGAIVLFLAVPCLLATGAALRAAAA